MEEAPGAGYGQRAPIEGVSMAVGVVVGVVGVVGMEVGVGVVIRFELCHLKWAESFESGQNFVNSNNDRKLDVMILIWVKC